MDTVNVHLKEGIIVTTGINLFFMVPYFQIKTKFQALGEVLLLYLSSSKAYKNVDLNPIQISDKGHRLRIKDSVLSYVSKC